MNKPTVTAAINAGRQEVTELYTYGCENGYRAWCFSRLDYGYKAWVESPKTWYASANQSRRLALVRAALDWACREFDLAIPVVLDASIEQGVWANHSVRDVLRVALPCLIQREG